jgi:hypothetical protein
MQGPFLDKACAGAVVEVIGQTLDEAKKGEPHAGNPEAGGAASDKNGMYLLNDLTTKRTVC